MTSPTPLAQQGPINIITGEPSDPDTARDQMINLFEQKTAGLKSNTDYYEAVRRPEAIGITVPPEMRKLLAYVGYPRLYVNSIAERLELEGFRLANADQADQDLWDWWQANDLDTEATLGYTEALVHGRSYITVAAPDPAIDFGVDPQVPIIRVESAKSLYAEIDPRTREVTQAIRVIYDAEGSQVTAATLYTPTTTDAWVKQNGDWAVLAHVDHGLGVVPVVPMTNRTLLSDLYGTSEITPELRSITDAAARILMDMQAAAELMAIPQRILFGVKPEQIGVDPATGQSQYDAYMARILAFEDPDGKSAQFSAAELRNYTEALDALDRKAAAYTGLPPQYLSFSSQNPASAEAIKSSEARLVKNAERKTKIFGGAWEKAMRVAYQVMKGGVVPPDYYRMESVWRDPSTPTYAAKADAASKLYANGVGVIPKERARIDMGYSIAERLEMQKWDQQESPMMQLAAVAGVPGAPKGLPSGGQTIQGQNPTNASQPTQTKTQSPTT